MSDHVALKGLQTQRDTILTEMNCLKQQIVDAQEVLNGLRNALQKHQNRLNSVDREVEQLKKKAIDPIVSEHAILRYLERVVGLDIEAHKRVILPPETIEQIKKLGNGVYPVRGPKNFKIRVQGGTVTTVTSEDGQ